LAAAAVLLSLLLAGGYAFLLGDTLRFYDEREYLGLVRSLTSGTGYGYDGVHESAYRPPGYPFLLAPVALLTNGSVTALRFVGVLSVAGSVWLNYLLGRRAMSGAAGALAALATACYPLIIYTATTLYPQIAAMFLLLLHVELALRSNESAGRPSLWYACGSGLAAGLLVLTVPTFGPPVAISLVSLWWRRCRGADRRVGARAVGVIALVGVLIPAVWCIRNAVELRAFVPVSTNSGVNLLLGNSENVSAGGGRLGDISQYESRATALRLGEVEADRYYTREALAWISEHPVRAGTLYLSKVANNFAYRNDLAISGVADPTKDLVSALTFYPVLALALARIVLFRRWRPHPVEGLAVVLIVVSVLVQAVFFTRLRFRVPLDGLTILLAAVMVIRVLQVLGRHHMRRVGQTG
jgi:4-amino-4-deoxy-L-arabinose transferase-like glycosyltransferase